MTPAQHHNQDLTTFYDLAWRTHVNMLDWIESLPPHVLTFEHN